MGAPGSKPEGTFKPAHTVSDWDFKPALTPDAARSHSQQVKRSASFSALTAVSTLQQPTRSVPSRDETSKRPSSTSRLDVHDESNPNRYHNPRISRFQERRHDGGFFEGCIRVPPAIGIPVV